MVDDVWFIPLHEAIRMYVTYLRGIIGYQGARFLMGLSILSRECGEDQVNAGQVNVGHWVRLMQVIGSG